MALLLLLMMVLWFMFVLLVLLRGDVVAVVARVVCFCVDVCVCC